MSSRRGGGGGVGRVGAKAKGALDALQAARNQGRANTFQLKKEDDIYDVVEEEEYGKLVHKRREEYGMVDLQIKRMHDARSVW